MGEWEEVTSAAVAAAGYVDYTSLTWDLRPHPRLGTVELREMDVQSRVEDVAALGALVQGLAAAAAERPGGAPTPSEALDEAVFRAARDGLDAELPGDGGLVPLREAARAALEEARPPARELGSDAALEGVERILRDGPAAAAGARRTAAAGCRPCWPTRWRRPPPRWRAGPPAPAAAGSGRPGPPGGLGVGGPGAGSGGGPGDGGPGVSLRRGLMFEAYPGRG